MQAVCPRSTLIDHFSALEDPRQSWKVLYPLEEILLCMANSYLMLRCDSSKPRLPQKFWFWRFFSLSISSALGRY
jgi:hypothetical protein